MTTGTLEREVIEVMPINTRSAGVAMDEAQAALAVARLIVIKTDEQRKNTAQIFNELRDRMKFVEEERKKITTPLNATLDAVNALFKRPYSTLKEARDITERACIAYDAEKERIRQEQERKLREAAAKEEARQRAIKEEQERQWREKERKAKEDADRLAADGRAEEAAKARAEAEKAQAKANERAQQAAEVFVPAPVIAQEKVKVEGTKDVTRWDYEIVDMNAIPDCFWVLDESKLAKYARDTKGTVPVAGVRFFPVKKLS